MVLTTPSSLELRIWNSTMGFVLLALACAGGVTILLAMQVVEKFSSSRSRSVHAIIHVLNFVTLFFLLSGFLLFLRMPNGSFCFLSCWDSCFGTNCCVAIKEDFGNRCNTGFGVCDSFSGSVEGK